MVRLNKKKIILLYQYYLLGRINQQGVEQKLVEWFKDNFLTHEDFLRQAVAKHLKSDWEFFRLPPVEKAILIYGSFELLIEQKPEHANLVINNLINFSKAYLEKEKIGYINKVLDLLAKRAWTTPT